MKTLLLISFFMAGCAHATLNNDAVQGDSPETVAYVDLERYQGTWHEIAAYPQWFQRDCTNTSATYTLTAKGTVKVLNSCNWKGINGKLRKAKGIARIADHKSNAKLKVQFFLPFLNLPFLAGDYWVVDLDQKDYSYAVVSNKERSTLWILYREESMPNALYNDITEELERRGFDLTKLQKTVRR